MGWEKRKGASYYYQKRRKGKQVVSEYVGAGPGAQLTSVMDELGQALHCTRREGHQAFIQLIEDADEALDVFRDAVTHRIESNLYAVGFHQHKSTWRRSHMSTLSSPASPSRSYALPTES
jgi:hypothetical protein